LTQEILGIKIVAQDKVLDMRKKVLLICPECLSRNYTTTKKVESNTTRLEIKKFCPKCGKHTMHKESK